MVECAQKARDNDLESFFDDLNDLTTSTSSSSDSSGSSASSNSEDEPTSVSSKKQKPRRVKTYHGESGRSAITGDPQSRGSVRRHTTVPKLGERGGVVATDDDDEEGLVDAQTRKLPFTMPTRARKAATSLIHENVNLRIENNKLKTEIAM